MCIGRKILKWCLRNITELILFLSNGLPRNWNGSFERSFESAIDVGSGEGVSSPELFLLVGFGNYRRSFTCLSALPAELTELYFESAKHSAHFETNGSKEELLRNAFKNDVFKARVRHCLSDTCGARKRIARDMLFQLLGYQILIPRFHEACKTDLLKNKAEVVHAHQKLFNRVMSRKELEML